METILRPAGHDDLNAILEIVNYNILHTTADYSYQPKQLQDLEKWLEEKQGQQYPVIVAEKNGGVTGYATYGPFRAKVGYKFTIEHSVYVAHHHTGGGTGSLLLAELVRLARKQGFHTMIGCIDADNTGSIAFHKRFGFTDCGVIKEAGFKFGRYLDLQFMQLILSN